MRWKGINRNTKLKLISDSLKTLLNHKLWANFDVTGEALTLNLKGGGNENLHSRQLKKGKIWKIKKRLWSRSQNSTLKQQPESQNHETKKNDIAQLFEYTYKWWRGNLYTFHYSAAVQPKVALSSSFSARK